MRFDNRLVRKAARVWSLIHLRAARQRGQASTDFAMVLGILVAVVLLVMATIFRPALINLFQSVAARMGLGGY